MHAKPGAISVADATTCDSHGLRSEEDRLLVWPRDFRPEADRILAGGVSHRYQYATDTARRATQLSLSANAIVPPSGLLLSSAKLPVAYAGLRHRQRLFRPPGWIYY